MRCALFVFVTAFTLACPRERETPAADSVLQEGDARLVVSSNGSRLQLRHGDDVRLDFPLDAFQVGTVLHLDPGGSYDPYWLEKTDDRLNPGPPADLGFETLRDASVSTAGDAITIHQRFTDETRAELVIAPAGVPGTFRLDWRITQHGDGTEVAFMRVRARASADEGFYGLGEWPDAVNHRGKLRPMQLEAELSVESASTENHVVVPLLIGTRGWGILTPSQRVGVYDVARKEPTLVEVTYGTAEASAQGLTLYLVAVEDPWHVTRAYYALTSPPTLPAPWALGPWIWRDENRDQAEVLDDVTKIRDLDLATSALWIDRPYGTAVGSMDFKPSQFPDAPAMIDAVHAAGLRLALWHVPYVEETAQPYRAQAEANGYLVTTHGPQVNPWGTLVDFTFPDAFNWWQTALRSLTTLGVEGFKLDYAEDVLPSLYWSRNTWLFHDGSDERTMHAGYTPLYHRAYAELLPADGGFLLCRAGRWGGQKYASVIWPGDLDATFTRHREVFINRDGRSITGVGGLPASIIEGLSLGPSGYPFFGADTGGYRHSPPGNELFIRWTQQTALSSVMQVGDSSSQPPWMYTAENGRDDATLAIYREYARLHLRLFPYEWTLATQIATTGRPIQRPLGLAFPALGEHPNDTYLFGDDLLVAPVIEDGARTRDVLFPPGHWYGFFDGVAHGPGHTVVNAPLAQLPLFQREGSIIPLLRPTIDTLAPATLAGVESFANDAGVLWARAIASPTLPSLAVVYDGTTLQVGAGGVSVEAVSGSVFAQGVIIELMGAAAPTLVTVDGAAAAAAGSLAELATATSGYWHQPGTLWIRLPAGTHRAAISR